MKFVGFNSKGLPVFIKSRKERASTSKYMPHQGKQEIERRLNKR